MTQLLVAVTVLSMKELLPVRYYVFKDNVLVDGKAFPTWGDAYAAAVAHEKCSPLHKQEDNTFKGTGRTARYAIKRTNPLGEVVE